MRQAPAGLARKQTNKSKTLIGQSITFVSKKVLVKFDLHTPHHEDCGGSPDLVFAVEEVRNWRIQNVTNCERCFFFELLVAKQVQQLRCSNSTLRVQV